LSAELYEKGAVQQSAAKDFEEKTNKKESKNRGMTTKRRFMNS
jgi:hypothetical protein